MRLVIHAACASNAVVHVLPYLSPLWFSLNTLSEQAGLTELKYASTFNHCGATTEVLALACARSHHFHYNVSCLCCRDRHHLTPPCLSIRWTHHKRSRSIGTCALRTGGTHFRCSSPQQSTPTRCWQVTNTAQSQPHPSSRKVAAQSHPYPARHVRVWIHC